MTRYEWDSPMPRVRKCILCYDALTSGELDQPACTAACPTKATIFGEREALLAEARRRIEAAPEKYVNHIWGEEEVGGTSVLYVSDVELTAAAWPEGLPGHAVPELATNVLSTVPATFLTVGAAMAGIHWIVGRRDRLAAEAATEAVAQPESAEDDEVSS